MNRSLQVPNTLVVTLLLLAASLTSCSNLEEYFQCALHARAAEGGRSSRRLHRPWPCCDRCGGCTRSTPPRCQCQDLAARSCGPWCRNCVRSPLSVDPSMYQCMDRVVNYCKRSCSPEPRSSADGAVEATLRPSENAVADVEFN